MSSAPSARNGRAFSRQATPAVREGVRALDLAGAGLGLVFLSPLLLAAAAAVRLTSRGPALYCSTRVGRYGRPFKLYKFRSMYDGASVHGPAITAAGDPRVTRLGRILRRSKLDELPQLLNILKGDMSLVGPRPEHPSYVALYSPEQRQILDVRPGLTSPASLRYRNEERDLTGDDWEALYIQQIMPAKLAADGEYLLNRTLWSDLRVIIATVTSLLRHDERPEH